MIEVEGDDLSAEYINGYFEGYVDGYTDGVIDVAGPPLEPLDPFLEQMVVASFEDWVGEQEQRSGRFFCGMDVRIDFPFEDTEYMALWAAHDCEDWDLYLTVVVDAQTSEKALAYAGAEPSARRGCYDSFWFEDV